MESQEGTSGDLLRATKALIKEVLEKEIAGLRSARIDPVLQEFVLRNGKLFTPVAFSEKKMAKQECFRNATLYAISNKLKYVEGYIIIEDLPLLMHHAWCSDGKDHAIDPTLNSPFEHEYFGVELDTDYVIEKLLQLGYYGLFQSSFKINMDVLEEIDHFKRSTTSQAPAEQA